MRHGAIRAIAFMAGILEVYSNSEFAEANSSDYAATPDSNTNASLRLRPARPQGNNHAVNTVVLAFAAVFAGAAALGAGCWHLRRKCKPSDDQDNLEAALVSP
ncbi:MAG: hypothetical protein K0R66_1071 [Gammaproteobacteria bacterium]|jgi:hypothetical protein|nr:hypothetical protein [Gammaproteobacteria bacterium]